jgi:hypothetical protein
MGEVFIMKTVFCKDIADCLNSIQRSICLNEATNRPMEHSHRGKPLSPNEWDRFERYLRADHDLTCIFAEKISSAPVFELDENQFGMPLLHGRDRFWSLAEIRAYLARPTSPNVQPPPYKSWSRGEESNLLFVGDFIPFDFALSNPLFFVAVAFNEITDAEYKGKHHAACELVSA